MPSFSQIYSQFNNAKANNLIGPDESLSDFARKALAFTGDPSYQSVAEGGMVGNFVRSRSADLTNLINAGPVDEWLGEGTKRVGDWFGVDPEVSRSVGESLPRMAVDFIPMAAGAALAPVTGGASLLPGLAATSALSGASAFEQTGELSDALIGAASPYVGSKLSEIGGRAALGLVPKSKILRRLGFTGGTQVEGRALTAAEQAGMVANQGLTESVAKATTKSFTELDKPLDKLLHYVGGEVAANIGFTGLDIAQQGTDAVFNRDYLFANLVSNVPFAAADLAGSFANRPVGDVRFNLPEAPPVYRSPGEERAVKIAAMFVNLKDPELVAKYRKEYGLDVSDTIVRTEELAMALNAKESGLRTAELNFVSKWNNYVQQEPLAGQIGLKPIQRRGAFGQELIGIKEVLGKDNLPIKGQEIVDEFKEMRKSLKTQFSNVVRKLGTPVNTVESLKKGVMELGLDEFLKTPVAERDYATALKGTWLSLDGVDLIRDIHRAEAGLEPVRPELFQEFKDMFAGKPATFTPDKKMELLVAASLARGQTPKFDLAKRKAQEAVQEGQPDEIVVEEALKGMEVENGEIVTPFEQKATFDPAKLEEFRAQRTKLEQELMQVQVAREVADEQLRQQEIDRINQELDAADKRFKAYEALKQQQKVEQENKTKATLLSVLSQRGEVVQEQEARPQLEQTIPDETPWFQAPAPQVIDRLLTSVNGVLMRMRRAENRNAYAPIPADTTVKLFREELKVLSIEKKRELAKQAQKELGYKVNVTELDAALVDLLDIKEQAANLEAVMDKPLDELQVELAKKEEAKEFKGSTYVPGEQRAEFQFARVDGKAFLVPLPEGEHQRVAEFARGLMAKIVPAEVLPEASKELVDLARLFNNPEVAYAEMGRLVKGTGDVRFARASAGAFDFGMREVQNGKLIRPGKPPLGTKDGWMTELEFRVNGGEFGPLQKDEVAFYKQLVPEAFAGDKVHLQKLWDGLGKVGEQVKVVTYGQDGEATPEKARLDELTHTWLETQERLVQERMDQNDVQGVKQLLPQNQWKIVDEFWELKKKVNSAAYNGPRATSDYNQISPFDTKKFPVVRVDVVLPLKDDPEKLRLSMRDDAADRQANLLWQQDDLHENLPNTLGWAMVQIVPDPKTGESVMFVGELQSRWGQAARKQEAQGHVLLPIHQNLILKSIIKEAQKRGIRKVAISDGETAMMTEEHDKDIEGWLVTFDGNTYRDFQDKSDAIDFAAGKGKIEPIRPSQEGGMRLAYDTTLPSIMKKLVGTPPGFEVYHGSAWGGHVKWQPHDMQHFGTEEQAANRIKRSLSFEPDIIETWPEDHLGNLLEPKPKIEKVRIKGKFKRTEDVSDDYKWRRISQEAREEGYDGLVYKNEWEGAGDSYLVFDKKNVLPFFAQGQIEDFGVHKNALTSNSIPSDAVNRMRAEGRSDQEIQDILGNLRLQGSPVFRNPDGTPKTNITARVYDISNPSPRAGTLFAQSQGRVYGSASYNLGQILINSKAFQGQRAADRLAFVFAHEQSHISFSKALNGKYGPQAKIQAEKALAWVKSADPQAKKNVEDVLKELHLDKELAGMDGVRDVLNNPDPEEWLANVMGMYGLGLVKAKAPKKAFAMLPKPVRQFTEWMVSHLQGLMKGAKTWLKLSGGEYEGAKKVKDLLDTVRRSYREAEWDAIQAEKFLDIEPSSMLERANEFAFARGGDRMGEVGEQPFRDAPKRWIGSMWNKIVQPMHTLANTHKEFVEPVMAVMNSHSDTENNIGDVFKVVVGELGADEKVRMTNKAFKRVMGSEALKSLFNAIQTRAEVVGKRMITVGPSGQGEAIDFDMLSPELRGRFQQFNPEAQRALVTMIAQAERANMLSQKKFLEADWQGSVYNFATLLASKASFQKGDFKKAVAIAEGVFGDLKGANAAVDGFEKSRWLEQAKSKLVTLDESEREVTMQQAQEMYGQFAGLEKFYQEHPTFMSFRRYGKIKQRIEKNGVEDVIDADTNKELAEKLKNYTAQGWKEVGPRKPVEKKLQGQYRMNEDLLRLMQAREKYFKEAIEASSLTEEEKTRLKSLRSASDVMIDEINSRELYRPTKRRKLSGDLERFDWWEQFQRYTPAAIAAAQKRALGAKVNFWMQNPELVGMKLQKDQFLALFEQSKKPDPEWARKLNKLNAVWHIGWNLPGHVAEVFQPMLSGVHELVAKGESLPKALGQFYRGEKDTMKVWAYRLKDRFFQPDKLKVEVDGESFEGLPAVWLKVHGTSKENVDIARMLHAKRDRIQKAPLSEIREFTGENHAKLQDAISGERERTLSEIISSPFTMYANAAMNFYSKFTQHNGIVTMVTAYRKFRKQGMKHDEAMQAAELFDLTVNNSGGRLERPEMFGKMGGAGHLPYGLTSYVRGRFSQLATYYRHGFDEGQFKDKLTPAEMKNARKAFQTMILAQIGAAGVLGLPFVGAGIALMEELLGEDLKGKMINALDEVTNDPNLTRVFTHGMMATMAEGLGIPADLHSRFAMSSFLGTNAYDGISAKSFMGPSVAMLSSMFNLGGQIAKGESLEKALTVAGPGGVRRLTEALSEEYQRDNPEANLAMSMLGFRSSEQVKRKEWDQITRKQELETRRKLEQSAIEISKAMALGIPQGRAQLLIEAEKLLPKGLDYQATVKQRQQNIKDLVQKVSMLEADKVAPQDVRREISGRLAPLASQTAQSMGVQMSDPMELARAITQQKTRSQLGMAVSQRPVRNAMLQEMQWERNPWEF